MLHRSSRRFFRSLLTAVFISPILLCFTALTAQNSHRIDSLKNEFRTNAADSNRAMAVVRLCMAYSSDLPDSCISYAEQGLAFCSSKKQDKYKSNLLKLEGVAYVNKGDYDKSLACYFDGVRIAQQQKNEKEEASILNNIGVNYWYQKEYVKAKEYYDRALTIRLRLGDKRDISKSYNNLGIISVELKKYNEALDYYTKALELKEAIGDRGGMADCYNNIGIVYEDLKSTSAALIAYQHALDIFKELDDVRGQIVSLNNIAIIHKTKGENALAIQFAEQSLALSRSIDDKEDIKNALELLSIASYNMKDFKSAYDYLADFSKMKDTLFDINKTEAMSEIEQKYGAEQNKQQIVMQELKIAEQQAEIDRDQLMKYFLYSMVGVLLLVSLLILNRYMIKKKAETVIAAQKTVVENQKRIVETKNVEILDSIRYAERIQNALLPPMDKVERILPDSFIFYKPKDIVSGDFYWCEQWGDQSLFAAVDCTGHGVPGAIISVVGHNLLNQAVNEHGLSQPNLILNALDKGVAKVLRKKDEDGIVQDGMDISIVSLRKKGEGMELDYSGAFNPLWVYSKSTNSISEIKADKLSIGNYSAENFKSFTNHRMILSKGDVVYIFTDGYADQFGGVTGKKFKYKNLQDLLLKNALHPMVEQKNNLLKTLEAWQGELEQIDDILVIGVRV